MRKLITVGVLVGGLLAGAGSAMAQPQGGIGDPLTLAASGVLIPYVTSGATISLLEVASPVSNNPNAHMVFFDANCNRVGPSVGMPLTTNDIAFQQIDFTVGIPAGTNGLVAISAIAQDGFTSTFLESPIHSRMYLFSVVDGTSRVLEPIILDTAEFPGDPHTWSPMRSAATFFAPLMTASVNAHLTLICPDSNIQGTSGGFFDPDAGFPAIDPPFPAHVAVQGGVHHLRVRIYNTNEGFLRNDFVDCKCLTQLNLENPDVYLLGGGSVYRSAADAPGGTYTELEEEPGTTASSFTGYRSVFTVGSSLNNFFGRLSNGSRDSIQGSLTNAR